tara:strand:+ start:367 stop:609 length:243 start_codon:yes stop_codon:yes gene_type:complete
MIVNFTGTTTIETQPALTIQCNCVNLLQIIDDKNAKQIKVRISEVPGILILWENEDYPTEGLFEKSKTNVCNRITDLLTN